MGFGAVKKAGFLLSLALLVIYSGALAQDTEPVYYLSGVPQSSFENPAYQNQNGKLVIGLPVLSGIYGRWNSSVPFNSFFVRGFTYSFEQLYEDLDQHGDAQFSAGLILFFASLRYEDYTFSVSVSEKGFSETVFDREIVRFIRDGTQDFYGINENLGNGTFYFRHYREVTAGVSWRLWENLDIGIRPKILFGKFNFEANDVNVSVETDTERHLLLARPQGSFLLSGPYSHQRDSTNSFSVFSSNVTPGDYFFQPRNLGIALDVGMVFRPDKRTEWSVSIIDAGLIGFRHNTFEVDFVRPIRFSEYTPYQSTEPDGEYYREPREALRSIGDSVSYIIDVEKTSVNNFSALPFKVKLAGKYKFSEKTTAGFSNQFKNYRLKKQNLFSVFVENSFNPKFNLYGSLTLLNTESVLPGLGASYTAEWLQFYFATNNILGIVQPASAKHLNLCFGVNFLFETQ